MTRTVTPLKPNMEIAKVIKKLYGETDGIFLLYDLNQEAGGATSSTVPIHRPEAPLDDVISSRHTIESRGNPPEF